ncbi:MAG: SMI1/KNR4 family protein [Planctomycetes bacterium]|nr:SMI1/KNR4 family protein [Planctomycetota bacterium]
MNATASKTEHIVRIQDLLDRWRELGSLRLACGVELIGRVPDEDVWLHAMFPPLDAAAIGVLQRKIGVPLPTSLRVFYRCCGGLSLFCGMFEMFGRYDGPSGAPSPKDIVRSNHQLDVLGWMPPGAVAFAQNSWDMSVHVAGMCADRDEVVRCDWRTGAVIERHPNVLACIDARLHRIDAMQASVSSRG